MVDERLRSVWTIFRSARELPFHLRREFVEAATSDPAIVEQVLRLLEEASSEASETGNFPVDALPAVGSYFSRYIITGHIGEGGMGRVCSALDMETGKPVAIKFLRPGLSAQTTLKNALKETRAAAALSHPSVITIYDIIRSADRVAISMEMVEGKSMRQLCGKPLPIDEVAHWGIQTAEALACAHASGIVHRDVKPENIMIRPDGQVKVLDFGLARFIGDENSTMAQLPAGTLRYMSPEQLRGERITGASDIFSLGLVLYEMCSGVHPFQGTSPFDTAYAILHGKLPVPLNVAVPKTLSALIMSMLAHDAEARPSIEDVVRTLAQLPQPRTASGAIRCKWIWTVGVCSVIALCFFFVDWHHSSASTQPLVEVSALGPDDPIPPRHIYGVSAGRLLLYVENSSDAKRGWLAEAIVTPDIAGVNWSAFRALTASGDGVIYALASNGDLLYFRLIDRLRNAGPMRWSSDSNTVIARGLKDATAISALSRPAELFLNGAKVLHPASVIRGGYLWVERGRVNCLFEHGWLNGGAPDQLQTPGFCSTAQDGNSAAVRNSPVPPPWLDCKNCRVIEGGDGITYIDPPTGFLQKYRIRPGGAWLKTAVWHSGEGEIPVIGHGWDQLSSLMAAPGAYSIEGYVSTVRTSPLTGRRISSLSIAPGDAVRVRVSTFSPSYSVRLIRLRRRMLDDSSFPSGIIDGVAVSQLVSRNVPTAGTFKKPKRIGMNSTGAGWSPDGPDLVLPEDARSGYYGAELTTPSGGRCLAPFIVKPPIGRKPNSIAVIANVTTWNAYNQWGGGSRRVSLQESLEKQSPTPDWDLSYERPLEETPAVGGVLDAPGLIDRDPRVVNRSVRAEVWITTWLDTLADFDNKYSYDTFSDVDLDDGISNLSRYKLLILDTNPEFWTDRMRDHLESFLAGGGDLMYLGGRGMHERVAISPDGNMRTHNSPGPECGPAVFPNGRAPALAKPCAFQDLFRWRSEGFPDGRSERELLGVAFEPFAGIVDPNLGGQPFVLDVPHPFFVNGTGLRPGSSFGDTRGVNGNLKAAGWEANSYEHLGYCPDFPNQLCTATHTILSGTRVAHAGRPGGAGDSRAPELSAASIVFRKTGNGSGWVFSAGSTSFGGVLAVDPVLQRIIRNAIDNALSGRTP